MKRRMISVFLVLAMLASVFPVWAEELPEQVFPDAAITVPAGVEISVGQKDNGHFVPFSEILPDHTEENEQTKTYYYTLTDDTCYNYRISSAETVTYCGTFVKDKDFLLEITEEMLTSHGKTKTTKERDLTANDGSNVADILLNINPKGCLRLKEIGDTYDIFAMRTWQALDNTINNYFFEPDFHYTVTDENGNEDNSVIEIDNTGRITAKQEGTAIVRVTYDALCYQNAQDSFFGAIWPENTGVFVVCVGAGEGFAETGMTIHPERNDAGTKLSGNSIDAEHDIIYFMGDTGEYTFCPLVENCRVWVMNPTVTDVMSFSEFTEVLPDENMQVTVPLTHGRNIVKIETDTSCDYQVITAKKVQIMINDGNPVHPGDDLAVVFDTLYHPANKLAGTYNMNAVAIYQKSSADYNEKMIGGTSSQYQFASNVPSQTVSNVLEAVDQWGAIDYQKSASLTIPEDYTEEEFSLSDGAIYVSGWGAAYGAHRSITEDNGMGDGFDIQARNCFLGKLPDLKIPISHAALTDVNFDVENIKTQYYIGEEFDATGLLVTLTYEDGTTQETTKYTVSPQIMTADTDHITISCKGEEVVVPVTVTIPKVTGISVTTPPSKTSYTEGETFDPTGMVVTVTYETGKTEETTEYRYLPNRELQCTDTQVTITYVGNETTQHEAVVPVSVAERVSGGGSGSNNVTVYFTLYGDTSHGENGRQHTMQNKNLTKWISKTTVTVPAKSSVLQVVIKALSVAGIPYENPDGMYIESVKGLSAMDNGPLSGWMFTVNGEYPQKSITDCKVKNDDVVVFHYTDDYTVEEDMKKFSGGSSTGNKNNKNDKDKEDTEKEEKEETKQPETVKEPNKFKDIKGHWAENSVARMWDMGLMKGVSDTEFFPDQAVTRGMFVAIMHRFAGTPKKTGKLFSDVAETDYFADAVIWAKEENIVNGTTDETFSPEREITREEMATILYRYAVKMNLSADEQGDVSQFEDGDKISDWAKDAFLWAVGKSIFSGQSPQKLAPEATATRAMVATVFVRFSEYMMKQGE